MKKALLIVHQEDSDPGLVGQLLRDKGYTLDIRCPAIDQPLPKTLDQHQAVVVFGGPMSANDDDTLPFIKTELDWLPTVLTTNTPFLGICLGAQLLSRALGGTIAPHPDGLREIGYYPITPIPENHSEFEQPMYVYQWHKEGFEVPSSAVKLAQGEMFANQAFRYGQSAYGIQFHPEITNHLIHKWTAKVPEQLSLPGAQSLDEHLRGHFLHAATVKQWLDHFLDRWLGTTALHVVDRKPKYSKPSKMPPAQNDSAR